MDASPFDIRVRLHRCESCGAPLEVTAEGGQIACEWCGAKHVVERRPPAKERPTTTSGPLLGVDDPRSPLPSAVLDAYRAAARTREKSLADAEAWWNEERARRSPGDRTSEAWLYLVAGRLGSHYSAARDHARARALLETMLDMLRGPEVRDLIRLAIARDAARAGDLDNARAWMASCSGAADVLDVDSQRRITEAVIANEEKDWPRMMAVLGSVPGAVPFAPWLVPLATVLRAHALERLGRADEGYRQIWACQKIESETMQLVAYQASRYGIAPFALVRFQAWQKRARLILRTVVIVTLLVAAAVLVRIVVH